MNLVSLFRRGTPELLTVRVARVRDEAIGIRSFQLVACDGKPLPEFSAGAHIDVQLSRALVRPYSICSDPQDRSGYMIAVRRAPDSRGGSRTMHEQVAEGDSLAIRRPQNNFALDTDASRHVLLAAGIGVTPLLAMARELSRSANAFEFHYFVRAAGHAAFTAELERLSGDVSIYPALGRECIAERLDELMGNRGQGAHLYVCGPDGFLAAAVKAAAAWPSGTVHLEHFHGDGQAQGRPRHSFEVRLARSGLTVPVRADESIADALENHGYPLLTSCREGVCGTCATRVLGGVCDHRDSFLAPAQRAANDRILPCVSRAKSAELVLDL